MSQNNSKHDVTAKFTLRPRSGQALPRTLPCSAEQALRLRFGLCSCKPWFASLTLRLLPLLLVLLLAGSAFAEEEVAYDAKGRRDPFVPLVSEGGIYTSDAYGINGIKDIRLEGIVWDEAKGSVAIINGEIAREGQKVGAAEVLRIEKDAVVFNIDGEEARLNLTSD